MMTVEPSVRSSMSKGTLTVALPKSNSVGSNASSLRVSALLTGTKDTEMSDSEAAASFEPLSLMSTSPSWGLIDQDS